MLVRALDVGDISTAKAVVWNGYYIYSVDKIRCGTPEQQETIGKIVECLDPLIRMYYLSNKADGYAAMGLCYMSKFITSKPILSHMMLCVPYAKMPVEMIDDYTLKAVQRYRERCGITLDKREVDIEGGQYDDYRRYAEWVESVVDEVAENETLPPLMIDLVDEKEQKESFESLTEEFDDTLIRRFSMSVPPSTPSPSRLASCRFLFNFSRCPGIFPFIGLHETRNTDSLFFDFSEGWIAHSLLHSFVDYAAIFSHVLPPGDDKPFPSLYRLWVHQTEIVLADAMARFGCIDPETVYRTLIERWRRVPITPILLPAALISLFSPSATEERAKTTVLDMHPKFGEALLGVGLCRTVGRYIGKGKGVFVDDTRGKIEEFLIDHRPDLAVEFVETDYAAPVDVVWFDPFPYHKLSLPSENAEKLMSETMDEWFDRVIRAPSEAAWKCLRIGGRFIAVFYSSGRVASTMDRMHMLMEDFHHPMYIGCVTCGEEGRVEKYAYVWEKRDKPGVNPSVLDKRFTQRDSPRTPSSRSQKGRW